MPTPAHGMPIEYWNGPVRLVGTMAGRPVSGVGFHERSKLWHTPHDLVFVLRETLDHLPTEGDEFAQNVRDGHFPRPAGGIEASGIVVPLLDQFGVALEAVENDLRIGVALELDDDADVLLGFVAQIGDAVEPLIVLLVLD